jgi:hypothetical protein
MLKVAEIQQAYERRVGKSVAPLTIYRLLERHGWRKVVPRPRHPKANRARQAAFKKLRRILERERPRQVRRRLRLMFQYEGRFGLLGTPCRCWAPRHFRPVVGARLLRKYLYAFAAVSPHDGVLDSLILPWVNAATMSLFLAEVAARHADEFIVMVMDEAGWHLAGTLEVPPTTRVVFLPPYSPELNPAEHVWEALREDWFANTVFADLDAVEEACTTGGTRSRPTLDAYKP